MVHLVIIGNRIGLKHEGLSSDVNRGGEQLLDGFPKRTDSCCVQAEQTSFQ